MAGIYDVHTHLNDKIYELDNEYSSELIPQAKKVGIDIMNIVGTDLKSSRIAIRQASQYRNVYAIIGIHPNEVKLAKLEDLEIIEEIANSEIVVGIGEVGLDYSHLETEEEKKFQKEFFQFQIKIAQNLDLPLMVHIKDRPTSVQAYQDVYDLLVDSELKKIIIHGYEGNEAFAKKFLDLGCMLSFNGKITYQIKELEKVVKNISLNNLLIESDAPYNSPVPYQKEINYPWNTNLVAEKIAQIKKIDVDEIISATRINGQNIFNL